MARIHLVPCPACRRHVAPGSVCPFCAGPRRLGRLGRAGALALGLVAVGCGGTPDAAPEPDPDAAPDAAVEAAVDAAVVVAPDAAVDADPEVAPQPMYGIPSPEAVKQPLYGMAPDIEPPDQPLYGISPLD